MTATVRSRRWGGQSYRSGPGPVRGSARALLVPALGSTEGAAHRRLRGAESTVLLAARLLAQGGRPERTQRHLLLVQAEMVPEPPRLGAATWIEAHAVDSIEDAARIEYSHEPTPANLARLIRATEAEVAAATARLAAYRALLESGGTEEGQ